MTTTDMPALADLTPKQAAWLDIYLATGNASEAYRQAFDCANMSAVVIHNEASLLTKHRDMAVIIATRRETASAAVDAAIVSARLGAPGNLERLDRIAALPVESDPEKGIVADARQLPSIKGAAETLLGIAEVIPRAGVTVDARSVTVNVGARDERLAGYSNDELLALLRALPVHGEGVDEPSEPDA